MGFYRIFPNKDNSISSKLVNGSINGESNRGSDPVLSVFSRKSYDVSEFGRILISFPLTELSGKMFLEKTIPSSSVEYKLKLHNMLHDDTVPTSYELFVYPISSSWDEGNGSGLDNLDTGYSNWFSASSTALWSVTGSSFITSMSAAQHFDRGSEDFEADITPIVNAWLTGNLANYGLVVKLGSTEENNELDYYIKNFHGRETKFIEKMPYIEARWSSVLKDNRNNFAYNQNNNLYLYNFVRGELTNLTEPIYVRIQDHLSGGFTRYSGTFTASFVETGIYSASISIVNTASFSGTFFDIWHSGAQSYMTGVFKPKTLTGSSVDQYSEFDVSIDGFKQTYSVSEEARLKVSVRKKNYRTHVGVLKSASFEIDREYMENMYYSIESDDTGEVLVPFGTGSSNPYTKLSYDANGNYFNLFFNSFIPGFTYRIKFLIDNNKYDKRVYGDNSEFVFKVI